jgi:hypothetical protein
LFHIRFENFDFMNYSAPLLLLQTSSHCCKWDIHEGCKLVASMARPSWHWQLKVTNKTTDNGWVVNQQGWWVGVLWSYVLGKQHRESFPKEGVSRANEVLKLIHCDVWGPTKTTSFGGVWYFLTFTNYCSRKTFCYFLWRKGECISKFLNFKAFAKMQ